MSTATEVTRRSSTRPRRPDFIKLFKQWLGVKDIVGQTSDRQDTLRKRILTGVEEFGEEDDNGNHWIYLPEPISFTDWNGKTFRYAALKRERHLTPANPVPVDDKAEVLLRKKGLWLTAAQEKVLTDIQTANPFVNISIELNRDEFTRGLFLKRYTDAEYERTLCEQKPSFQFRPSES
jgi:hypothetical protein